MTTQTKQPLRKVNQIQATYYSKSQTNFFKAYAHQVQFVNRLNDLLNVIQKRKVTKLTQEVKLSNKAFKRYLNQKRIVYVKIEDVIEFQEMYQKTTTNLSTQNSVSQLQSLKRTLLPSLISNQSTQPTRISTIMLSKNYSHNKKKPSIFSQAQQQLIKKGFMRLLQRLQTLKKQQFINETKYLQGVLMRESHKLKEYQRHGEDTDGGLTKRRKYIVKIMNLCDQIDDDEKVNGLYPMIMKNAREETLAVENAENTFGLLMNN